MDNILRAAAQRFSGSPILSAKGKRNTMHVTHSIAIVLADTAAVILFVILWRMVTREVRGRRVRRSLRLAVHRELGLVQGSGRESAGGGDGLAA